MLLSMDIEVKDIKKQNNQLINEVGELRENNNELLNEVGELRENNNELLNEVGELREDNNELQEQVVRMFKNKFKRFKLNSTFLLKIELLNLIREARKSVSFF